MLQEVFYWLFNMSIVAAMTGLLVMLIRTLRRIPRRLTALLWLIPFFRMAVPLGLNSPYSFMSLLSRITTRTVVVYQPVEGFNFSVTNSVMAANSYFPITYKVNIFEKIFGVASVIWMIVFLAIALTLAVLYFTTMREMRDARRLRDNIYLSGKIVSPAVYGIIKPKIILPPSYADKDIELLLLHERTHIRRGDNLWRMLAFFVASAHWFNPLAWVFLKMLLADMELACDERVLVKLGVEHTKDYALSLVESRESADIFASAFGGARIRTRVENILSFKKMTGLSLVISLAFIAAIFYVLLTNAA